MYYENKLKALQEIFGTSDVQLDFGALRVQGVRYPIRDDVIILSGSSSPSEARPFAKDIQFTFGQEWSQYDQILPEHEREFRQYFDLVDLARLKNARACDLGCGNGRWSYFLSPHCRELVLVDFSEAIFVARHNLRDRDHCLFFQCDLQRLPFQKNFADFLFCLGVLHHLPTPCLQEVRALKRFAPELLIFLYYALDNRPWHFRALLKAVTGMRMIFCQIRSAPLRKAIAKTGTYGLYLPLIFLGKALRPLHLSPHVPLYEFYHTKTVERIEQDVYDRFFTRIEQRVTRQEILALKDSFSTVRVSDHLPFWHFLCTR